MRVAGSTGGIRMGWGVFLACWMVEAGVALVLGRDTNWDLRNYHYYNAYALLTGRWTLDLAAAGSHTFLHPGLDLPFYLLTRSTLNVWPSVVLALQAGYAGLLAFLVLTIANLICLGAVGRVTPASLLVAAFGLTGAATLSEAGSTHNDIQVGCAVVGALLALLLAVGADRGGVADPSKTPLPRSSTGLRRGARLWLLAGGLGGAACGLKLTAIIYPPALALAATVAAPGGAAARARAVGLLMLGGLLGFGLVYGPWGWFLYERFGNPFGPFFNEVFHSPWFLPKTARDDRFLPAGLAEGLVYPLHWIHHSEWVVTEPPMADPRFALGLSALMLYAGATTWHAVRYRPAGAVELAREEATSRRAAGAVMAFLVGGYVAWLSVFSILRYAVPLEVLLGVPVWAALRTALTAVSAGRSATVAGQVPDGPWPRSGPLMTACLRLAPRLDAAAQRGRTACSALAGPQPPLSPPDVWEATGTAIRTVPERRPGALLSFSLAFSACALATEYPDWGRTPLGREAGGATVTVTRTSLPEGSLVVPLWGAVSFVAPFLEGTGLQFVGAPHPDWAGDAGIAVEARRRIQSHPGPIFLLLEDPGVYDPDHLRRFGLHVGRSACRPVPNNLTAPIHLCRWR